MDTTLIRHQVQDFGRWKEAFDGAEAERRENGETAWQVFQDANNPNEVTVLTTFADGDSAQRWLGSDAFREKITQAGVVGEPEIRFLSEA